MHVELWKVCGMHALRTEGLERVLGGYIMCMG